MTDGAGTINYTYDNRDRLTQATRGTDTFTYAYDPVGRVASRTNPDGTTTTYSYDDDGRMSSAASGGNTTSYSYDPAAELTQTTLPNSIAETYTYNHAGLLTQLNDGFRTFAYGYDAAGNVTSRSINGISTSYTYDTIDRLTDVTGATTIHYGYDPVGNRTTSIDSTGTTTTSYDAGDQLQSAVAPGGTTSYGFDANGNETSAGAWTYTVNLAGQLTAATNGTTSTSYGYDGDGNRISSTSGGQTDNLLWDGNFSLPQLALERDSSGTLIRRYTYGESRISMTTSATTAYYSTDMLGSTTELSGSSGTLLGQYDTNPYGDGATSTNVDPSVAGNPYCYTGEYQDPTTGLYNLRARQYDTNTGRFLAPDPLGPQDAASTYTYVADNPLAYTDPSGMKRKPTCSITCKFGGAVYPYVPPCATGATVGIGISIVTTAGATAGVAGLTGCVTAVGAALLENLGGKVGGTTGITLAAVADAYAALREGKLTPAEIARLEKLLGLMP